jgi:hypothetical protein
MLKGDSRLPDWPGTDHRSDHCRLFYASGIQSLHNPQQQRGNGVALLGRQRVGALDGQLRRSKGVQWTCGGSCRRTVCRSRRTPSCAHPAPLRPSRNYGHNDRRSQHKRHTCWGENRSHEAWNWRKQGRSQRSPAAVGYGLRRRTVRTSPSNTERFLCRWRDNECTPRYRIEDLSPLPYVGLRKG